MLSAHFSLVAAALGSELTESEASVRVFVTAGGLAVLGCALLLFTIWWWRGTRPEPSALAPLEVMSDRRWQNASESERRRMVEMNRPEGSLLAATASAPVPIDLSELARDQPSGFDDLRDDPTRWPFAAESIPSADGSVLGVGIEPDSESEWIATPDDASTDAPAEVAAEQLELVDATMYQVELPEVSAVLVPASLNGVHDQDDPPDQDEFDIIQLDLDEPSAELVIDPLLQRAASQD